jgi:hypothetical protein
MTESYYAESVALFRELGHKEGLAEVLADFGVFCQIHGDYERASTLVEESISLRREIGHTRGIAAGLDFLGTVTYRKGDIQRASVLWEESLLRMRAEMIPNVPQWCLLTLRWEPWNRMILIGRKYIWWRV